MVPLFFPFGTGDLYMAVLVGKSHHSAAILAVSLGTYFWLRQTGSNLNEWGKRAISLLSIIAGIY